ncbi:UNVERIFIED_CONTAM: hypothetical protein PYX00_007351 [Menopon gallinae]|uniref:Single-strand selective monofunctional uracil DNA glycosylase n=1 Tax=Menopon gallinae TaxID=328185 RepID=A0AAW2HJL9_9NEOP
MGYKKLKTCDSQTDISDKFLNIEYDLSEKLSRLTFNDPIFYVYNPLEYARELHVKFVRKYYNTPGADILFLGMNPGPWGMSQTGIPFGDSRIVREWFGIEGCVSRPEKEHPERKISGLKCERTELSGTKFWGLMKDICGSPERFFEHCFVYNICPLAFLSSTGTNVTPAEIKVTSIPHPSPRNRKYYSIWERVTVEKLQELGVYQLLEKNQT